MNFRVIVLYSRDYSILDERTGAVNQGVTINFLTGSDLKPVNNTDGSKGARPGKASLPIDKISKLSVVPGIYDAKFDLRVGSDGKPTLRMSDLDYVSEVTILE